MSKITFKDVPAPPAGKLKTLDLFLISMGGVIGAGVITLIGPAIGMTGYSVWLAYAAAILLGFLMIFPIIIASTTIRVGGGIYSLCGGMSNPTIAGMMSYTYMIYVLSAAIFAIAIRTYLGELFPALNTVWTAVIVLTIFYVINLLGLNVFAKAAAIMTWVLFAGLILFIAYGLPQISQPIFDFGGEKFFAGGIKGFAAAAFLLMYSTQGYYIAIFYGAGAKKATRDIPKAILLCIPFLIILYVGVAIVNVGVLPLEETAGKTLIVAAKNIMPPTLATVFIIAGPIMALTTTLNANFSMNMYPLRQACRDGWLPRSFATENRYGIPWKVLTYQYLIALIPLLLNFNITLITNNIQLVLTCINVFVVLGIWNIPKKFPEAWAKSKLHMPKGLFYMFMCIAIGINGIIFVNSLLSLTPAVAIGNSVLLIAAVALGLITSKKGNVIIETSVWTDNGAGSDD
ncbi:MAG: amino acid permease [Clostridiaceae bacterium]|jgi:APA family basic amino acid/polyamine antiporter|nr:amino acid permease [Clostridiaceae bacterium]